MTTPRNGVVLLANEAGRGRGHAEQLLAIRTALGADVPAVAGLGFMPMAPMFEQAGVHSFLGIALASSGPSTGPSPSFSGLLGKMGLAHSDRLAAAVGWWVDVMRKRDVRLVVADFAPIAGLAARALSIPLIAVGTGYSLPPAHLRHLPPYHPERPEDPALEPRLVENINAAACPHGLPPLRHFPELFKADLALVRALPMTDPYARHRRTAYAIPISEALPPLSQPEGDAVFCYFSTRELDSDATMAALETLGLPCVAYLPRATPEQADRLAAAGVELRDTPMPRAEILRRARVFLTGGQHGTLCLGLLGGRPQICVTPDLEKALHAGAASREGAVTPLPRLAERDTIIAAVHRAHADGALLIKAMKLADRLRATLPPDPSAHVARQLAPFRALVA